MNDLKTLATAFHQGTCLHAHHLLGVHGQGGEYLARVLAPAADAVFLVGDFNAWGEAHPMARAADDPTVFEVRVPAAEWERGSLYKFKLITGGEARYLPDPFARCVECAPERASLYNDFAYPWRDASWRRFHAREMRDAAARPMHIYAFSDVDGIGFEALARELPSYVKAMGFTHVALLGAIGAFAPEPRFGTPQALMRLVDALHEAGVGVILELPADGYRTLGDLPLSDLQVCSVLLSSATLWAKDYHADGLLLSGKWQEGAPLREFNRLWREACPDVPTLSPAPASGLGFSIEPVAAPLVGGRDLAEARAAYERLMAPLGPKMLLANGAFALQSASGGEPLAPCELADYEHFVARLNLLCLEDPARGAGELPPLG